MTSLGPTPTDGDVIDYGRLVGETSAPADYQPPRHYTDDDLARHARRFLDFTDEEVGL